MSSDNQREDSEQTHLLELLSQRPEDKTLHKYFPK